MTERIKIGDDLMENFNYSIPTKIFFGEGKIEVLGKEIKKHGSRVLLAYGGGSIKKIGLYDKVVKILDENNIPYFELSGIEPNPRVESVEEGVRICRENDIDLILAVGGGSTIDCAKVIAGSVDYDGNPLQVKPILKIRGKYRHFGHLETALLGVLSVPTRIATKQKMSDIIKDLRF